MSDTITIVGNLAAEPEPRAAGTIASFRVGSTQRRFDKESGRWIDTYTNWYNVSAFRQLGAHALQSLHKGQRVIVTGKVKLREWENSTGRGTSVDIDAEAIGHDLLWGTSEFHRGDNGAGSTEQAVTEWRVQTPGEDQGDAWGTPMAPPASAPEPSSAPESAADDPRTPEPAYAGADEAPF